uniref:Galectin n=1 Tax=Astyanax mexicanus TaxID=7994 RepID=A0A3B1JGY6_ASTMX
ESASVEPFTSGAPFTMFFVTTPQGYEVQCLKHRYFHKISDAFHFNPRMGQRVAMNSFRNGKWESEESASILIPLQVYVNGFQHCLFKHRIPLEKVTTLIILHINLSFLKVAVKQNIHY